MKILSIVCYNKEQTKITTSLLTNMMIDEFDHRADRVYI